MATATVQKPDQKPDFDFWQEFLRCYRESIVIQSYVTGLLLTTCCVLWLVPVFRGGPPGEIPPLLAGITGTVVGFWFKAKNQYQAGLAAGKEEGK